MSLSWGQWKTSGADVGEGGPSPQNPEAVCILMPMLSRLPQPHCSQGTAVAATPAQVLSLLLLSPLWAENDVRGKKKKKTKKNPKQNPKVKEQTATCPGGKGSCGMPEGELSESLRFCIIAPSLNAITQFIGQKAEASVPKSVWRFRYGERQYRSFFFFFFLIHCSVFCSTVFPWFCKAAAAARCRVIRHLRAGSERGSRRRRLRGWGRLPGEESIGLGTGGGSEWPQSVPEGGGGLQGVCEAAGKAFSLSALWL